MPVTAKIRLISRFFSRKGPRGSALRSLRKPSRIGATSKSGASPEDSGRTVFSKALAIQAGLGFISILAIFGLVFPVTAKASVWSDLIDFFKPTKVEASQTAPKEESVQTMPLLHAATNIDPNPTKGAGEVTIVDDSAVLSEAGPVGTLADIDDTQSHMISTYVVRKGDNLSTVAQMFNIKVNTILWANDLPKGSVLKEGQVLTILPISGVGYTTKSGDTIASIAKRFNADAEEIAQFNGLDTGQKLAVGTDLLIPDGEIAAPPAPKAVASSGRKSAKAFEPLLVNASVLPDEGGYFIRPLSGGIRTQGLHGYNGVDIAAAPGTPIYASAAGRVIISRDSGYNGGYGNYVVISHDNGTQTLYGHLQRTAVSVGTAVGQGEVIGYMGNTGRSTGTHLHFEVRGAKNPF